MEFMDYVRAGCPAIILTTPEERRALQKCEEIAKENKLAFGYWSLTKGMRTRTSNQRDSELTDPVEVLKKGLEVNYNENGGIYCVLDFHPFINTADVWRTAKDVFQEAKNKGITFVFIGVQFKVPLELQHEVIVLSMQLPTREELRRLLREMAQQHNCKMSKDEEENAVEAASGLTTTEAENAYAISISKKGNFDRKLIARVKEQIICNGGLLEYKSFNETFESVGGLQNFTTWAMKRLSAYSPEAQKYGLPYPRGVLLIGVPGCGKSLSVKALANMWQKPLLKLDVGKLFGSFVGDTEANTRKAIQTAEAMAPAILWIDEIEKGLSGVQTSGKTDSGVTARMFGTILTWLQEKKAPVFVMATANNISKLPPEFLRKGRFDEIFFVDLPDQEERKAIFKIQLKKYNRNPEKFDVEALAKKTDGYTGAEIEECVVSAMFNSWNDGRELNTADVLNSIEIINPMAKGIMKEQVDSLQRYAETSCIKRANKTTRNVSSESSESSVQRVIRTV